eukprot:g202.t1
MLASRGSADHLVGMSVSTSSGSLVDLQSLRNSGNASPHHGVGLRLWLVASLISLSSFLFGYSMGVLNIPTAKDPDGSYPVGSLMRDVDLSSLWVEILTSLTPIGALIGSACAGNLSETFGRRTTLLGTSFLFVISAALCCLIDNPWVIASGRFLAGLATGMESAVAPVLLTEIAPAAVRGAVTTLHQLAITVGLLIASIIGFLIVPNFNHGWKFCLGISALPALLQLACASFLPESPRWLTRQGRRSEARVAMRFVCPKRSVLMIENDLRQMDAEVQREANLKAADWAETFAFQGGVPVLIGCGLMFFSAFTGINTIIFYSSTVFKMAHVDNAFAATVSTGAVNVIVTILSIFLIDRFGRTVLLKISCATMVLSLACLSSDLLFLSSDSSAQGLIAVACVLIYIFGYAIGMGAVCWVVMNEVMPTRIRGRAFGLFVSMNWASNVIISLFTLSAIELLGGSNQKKGVAILYAIFSCLSLCALIFVSTIVPETKGIVMGAATGSYSNANDGFQKGVQDGYEGGRFDEENGGRNFAPLTPYMEADDGIQGSPLLSGEGNFRERGRSRLDSDVSDGPPSF